MADFLAEGRKKGGEGGVVLRSAPITFTQEGVSRSSIMAAGPALVVSDFSAIVRLQTAKGGNAAGMALAKGFEIPTGQVFTPSLGFPEEPSGVA